LNTEALFRAKAKSKQNKSDLKEKNHIMSTRHYTPIKAFDISFNWDATGPAKPGLYGQADPAEHIRWHRELGGNVIGTSCVSFNGYAWYKDSAVAPVTPDMTHDFLPEMVELAHREGMLCLGYFCLSSNPVWRAQHPKEDFYLWPPMNKVSETINAHSIIYTDEYLDYFARMIQDGLRKTDMDGFMVDWLRPPERGKPEDYGKQLPVADQRWLPREKQLYRELMRLQFPIHAMSDSPEIIEYERRLMERAWVRIKEAVASVRPAIIWTNHPFRRSDDPLWTGHRVLKEADWILNESPEVEFLDWLHRQIGPHTRIIQNLCGWKNHDASIWKKVDFPTVGLYGFCQADPKTTLASADYMSMCAANQKNIAIVREAYHALPGSNPHIS
jgi:hypothetical protein